jgi:3-dehydroquinate dehydratase-1
MGLASPRICVVVTAKDTEEALERISNVASQEPDLIEVRFDYMESPRNPRKIRESTRFPLIATNRRKDQWGYSGMREPDRVAAILGAVEAGFEYADLELNTPDLGELGSRVKALGGRLIVSHHDFLETPPVDELRETMRRMGEQGADVCKIVGTAQSPGDNLVYLSLYESRGDVGRAWSPSAWGVTGSSRGSFRPSWVGSSRTRHLILEGRAPRGSSPSPR